MLRYFTAGESHGKQLTAIIDGFPAGLNITAGYINNELDRRRQGYGRGERVSKIEKDSVEIVSGVRSGRTIGSPVTLVIKNSDWDNDSNLPVISRPRPGHADLAGVLKYGLGDIRDILERASARETAIRVACGALFKKLLEEFDISVYSFTKEIGGVAASLEKAFSKDIIKLVDKSPVRSPDPCAEKEMMEKIKACKENGDTLGGVFTVVARGVMPGLGSHTQWDAKLDAKIARALMSIQAVKGVEFGIGFDFAERAGSLAHDEIFYLKGKGYYRKTNNAGGIEGGMSNGEDIVVSSVIKPIPSLVNPLNSVDMKTKQPAKAQAVRSDVCVVPAAGVIGEAVIAFELASAIGEKFGADSINELKRNVKSYLEQINSR